MPRLTNKVNEERWAARVADWRASGLTSTAFCKGRDFTPGGLRHWAYVLKRRGVTARATTPRAIRRVQVKASAPAAPAPPLTIEVGGARLAVPGGFDSSTLRTVLETLVARGGGQR